ncbi:MAG: bifunctional DNA-formamidopyrimidine glycosylase/DNA-(apurinic or apyrimidinic site) lyase [Pseudomonadota bacterium]
MPELPEVETVRRGLAPALVGATLARVTLRRPDLRFPFPDAFATRLEGARVDALSRRGKYMTAALSTGETLIVHLGMTGRFTVTRASDAESPGRFVYEAGGDAKHDHVVIEAEGGEAGPARLVFNDARRFGFMDLAPTATLGRAKHFAAMGPEPLSAAFDDDGFAAALRARRTPIKAALLDQRVVAGLGNIYVCEALFRAGVSPRRRADRIAAPRVRRLRAAIVAVLEDAIEAGGSTLRDFAGTDGELGYFQHAFDVYGRDGALCRRCGATLRRIVQSGRSTFYCAACQR